MVNKKGLSDVITTVLIILLVLAAVVLIWGFIRSQLQSGGTQIQTGSECIKLQLTPVSCVVTSDTSTPPVKTAAIGVKWAGGSVTLKNITYIVTGNGGANVVSIGNGLPPSIYATASQSLVVSTLTTPMKLSASGKIQLTDGSIADCPETDAITCT